MGPPPGTVGLGRRAHLLYVHQALLIVINELRKDLFEPLQLNAISNWATLFRHTEDKRCAAVVGPHLRSKRWSQDSAEGRNNETS